MLALFGVAVNRVVIGAQAGARDVELPDAEKDAFELFGRGLGLTDSLRGEQRRPLALGEVARAVVRLVEGDPEVLNRRRSRLRPAGVLRAIARGAAARASRGRSDRGVEKLSRVRVTEAPCCVSLHQATVLASAVG